MDVTPPATQHLRRGTPRSSSTCGTREQLSPWPSVTTKPLAIKQNAKSAFQARRSFEYMDESAIVVSTFATPSSSSQIGDRVLGVRDFMAVAAPVVVDTEMAKLMHDSHFPMDAAQSVPYPHARLDQGTGRFGCWRDGIKQFSVPVA